MQKTRNPLFISTTPSFGMLISELQHIGYALERAISIRYICKWFSQVITPSPTLHHRMEFEITGAVYLLSVDPLISN